MKCNGDEASRGLVYQQLYIKHAVPSNQKMAFDQNLERGVLFDGRNCDRFDQPVTVGYPHILKLNHLKWMTKFMHGPRNRIQASTSFH
jgi:DNA-directed RNA polymerase beta subunit